MNAKPPNILLIVTDCARSDKWLGANRHVRTPNLDKLAAGGVALTTAITEKSCTTPSFSTLLTGEYSPKHGVHLVWGYRLPESVPMLTEAFAKHGYHTYAEVSGPLLPEMGLDRGFENYSYRAPCDHLHTAWGDQFVERLRTGHFRGPWLIMLHVWELHPHRHIGDEFKTEAAGRDEYEQAISSLDAQLERIFAAAGDDTIIAFTGDHGEKTRFEQYQPGTAVEYARELLGIDDAEGMAPFAVAGWAGPSVLQQLYGKCTPLMRDVRVSDLKARPSYGFWARLRDRLRLLRLTPFVYLHDLLSLGAPLKLTRMLERRGLLDPYRARRKVDRFADSLGRERLLDMHMRMWTNSYKHNYHEGHMVHVYDFLVRVPFVLGGDGLRRCLAARGANAGSQPRSDSLVPGASHDRMVRQPDFLPTLLDIVGIDPAECGEIAGRSFKPLIDGKPWEPQPAFVSVSGCPADLEIRGVRTETHKYTYGPHNAKLPVELYDLTNDPGETNNIASEQAERCNELRALADSFVNAPETAPVEQMALDSKDQAAVEKHLQELGYLE
jgi:arylsulfatase A-like enzyme